MKGNLRRGIGIILILAGLSMIGMVYYRKMETDKKQQELQAVLQNIIKDEGTENSGSDKPPSIEGFTPIAMLEIPSIKLSQGVVSGVTDDALQYYLGHFEGSAMPGENGNFSVAGHRVSNYSDAFVNLYKVEVGDDIIVKSNGKKFIYKIEDKFIVTPDNVGVLDNTKNPTITLVTCTLGAKERLIVKGSLVSKEDI